MTEAVQTLREGGSDEVNQMIGASSEETLRLLEIKEAERKRVQDIDSVLREMVGNENLLEFLVARDRLLPLVIDPKKPHHWYVALTGKGEVVLASYPLMPYRAGRPNFASNYPLRSEYKLVNVTSQPQRHRLSGWSEKEQGDRDQKQFRQKGEITLNAAHVSKYQEFIGNDGTAFVCVRAQEVGVRPGDLLATRYLDPRFSNETDKTLQKVSQDSVREMSTRNRNVLL